MADWRRAVTLPAASAAVVAGFCGQVQQCRAHWVGAMQDVSSIDRKGLQLLKRGRRWTRVIDGVLKKTLTNIPRIHDGGRFCHGNAERAKSSNGGPDRPKPHSLEYLPLRTAYLLTKAHLLCLHLSLAMGSRSDHLGIVTEVGSQASSLAGTAPHRHPQLCGRHNATQA